MRLFLIALLIFIAQTAFAIPSATPEQCAKWTKKIAEYNDKQLQAGSLEKKAYYRSKIEANQIRLRAGRCRPR